MTVTGYRDSTEFRFPRPFMMPFGLERLVDDILINIIRELSVQDVLALRQTSKRLALITTVRYIWYTAFCRDVLEKHIPLPGAFIPLEDLSSYDLEWRTCRAIRLDRKWMNSRNMGVKSIDLPRKYGEVDQVLVIVGGRQVITVHQKAVVCWDVGHGAEEVRCMGVWARPSEHACFIVRDSVHPDRIAVSLSDSSRKSEVFVLRIRQEVEDIDQDIFETLGSAAVAGVTMNLHGRLLSYYAESTDHTQDSSIGVVDWQAQCGGTAFLRRFVEQPSENKILGMHFYANYIVLVWPESIGVYTMPSTPDTGNVFVKPLVMFGLRDRLAHPLVFSTCEPSYPSRTPTEFRSSASRPLTIIAHLASGAGLVQSILNPTQTLPSPVMSSLFTLSRRRVDSSFDSCTALIVGPSGRGLGLEPSSFIRCRPALLMHGAGLVKKAVEFYPAIQILPNSYVGRCGEVVDFDEGMGRVVIRDEETKDRVVVIDFM